MSGIPESLARALTPDFELLRTLGTGRLGVVYLAREPALRRLVAVKLPRPELATDSLVRRRFEREARAAARLSHPNIAAIHRVGRLPDDTPYLVMAYTEGRTLADALQAEGALDEDAALEVLAQIAGALAAAHAQGVIHRDVRPGNIIWQPERRRAVLLDFGLAGILETGSETVTRLTEPGQLLADPTHVSPEQLLGEALTPATDVYGLGVLGYEVLALQQPYRVTSPAERTTAHLYQPPRDLGELVPGVDPGLKQLLEHCLAKRPEHRPRALELERRLRTLAMRPGGGDRARGAAPGAVGPAGAGTGGTAAAGMRRSSSIDDDEPAAALGPSTVNAAVEQLPALKAFLLELKQRRVYNVAIIYIGAAFVLLQFADSLLSGLPLPSWVYPALVDITIAGFPIALALAWMFDVTARGIQRAGPGEQVKSRLALFLIQTLALALSLGLAGLLAWWLLRPR